VAAAVAAEEILAEVAAVAAEARVAEETEADLAAAVATGKLHFLPLKTYLIFSQFLLRKLLSLLLLQNRFMREMCKRHY
jgi:hypothetical protein